jgi:hypothetical protein
MRVPRGKGVRQRFSARGKSAEIPWSDDVSWRSLGPVARHSCSVSRAQTAHQPIPSPRARQDDQTVKTKPLTRNCLPILDRSLVPTGPLLKVPAAWTAEQARQARSRMGWTSLSLASNNALKEHVT